MDLSRKLQKRVFEEDLPALRRRLAELHWHANKARIASVVVFEGLETAGKGETISLLTQRLDPRGFKVHPIGPPGEPDGRPWVHRFWLRVPAAGVLAIFDRSWYGRVLDEELEGDLSRAEAERAPQEIREFERMLIGDGVLLIKFWLQIGRKEQRDRLRALEDDPIECHRVGKRQWRRHAKYDDWVQAADRMIELTGSASAPWTIVESNNRHFAFRKVYDTLIAAFARRLEEHEARSNGKPRRARSAKLVDDDDASRREKRRAARLAEVSLDAAVPKPRYEKALVRLQAQLTAQMRELYRQGKCCILAMEGWDASGKGGAIRRVTQTLDPRGYEVHPIGAPTGDDKERHYLYRFWRRLPAAGQLAVFDRTWYGRVLVERVEGFAAPEDWKRAYREICEFERQIVDAGSLLLKFWIHLSPDEQLRRFKERANDPLKGWKLTPDDWRNRKKWSVYAEAADEMLARTHTSHAPWTIVAGNDKYHARLKVLEQTVRGLARILA